MRQFISAALLHCLFLSPLATYTFAQADNGQVSGTVQDGSRAVVPGVTVTLTNIDTRVAAVQRTNQSGVYNFPSVPAGSYSLSASQDGFKTSVTNDVQVRFVPVRVNITLELPTVESTVEVRAAPDVLLAENTATVGIVLSQQMVTDLPLVGQNVLSLLDVLPGFRVSQAGLLADISAQDQASTVTGLSLDYTNATINGLSTVNIRDAASTWGRQVLTSTVVNPDLVAEIRLILSPVDAEFSRGNSQIQIQTRSGTNKYRGTVVWNVQNTALNANTWVNKRNPGQPTQPDWYNLNQITGSYGGPIVPNKTFFFFLFDKQLANRRNLIGTQVLTDTARQGIWRYWEGWNPGNALQPQPTSFVAPGVQPTGTAPSVDFSGTPIAPNFNPSGGAYTLAGLRCFSLFGDIKVDGSPFTQADCPGGTAVIKSGAWDPRRTTVDSTGYIRKILEMMPHPNYFAAGDGLNTAFFRWLQGRKGPTDDGALFAVHGVVDARSDYNNRDQINVKIDHNISTNHRFSASWTYQRDSGDAAIASWGTGLNGETARRPQFLTLNGTSTLSPNLVNEARFGLDYNAEFGSPPWANSSHQDIRDAAQNFILYGSANAINGKKYPVLYNPGTNWNGFMAFDAFSHGSSYSPRYNFADTLRWTHGKHTFGFGGEYSRLSTAGHTTSRYIPVNPGNAGGTSTPLFFTNANLTNGPALCGATTTPCQFLAATRNNAGGLLSTLYGAINAPSTAFWIDSQDDAKSGKWQDVTTVENRFKSGDPYGYQTLSQVSNEWSFFAKDDYRLSRRLTLNIGVRYNFTGSPYLKPGLTNTIDGGGLGLFGAGRPASGDPLATWLTPGNLYLTGYGRSSTNPLQCAPGVANPNGLPTSTCDPNSMSTVIFVGPGTDRPDLTLVPERGHFSPAIGASWQLPWFGEGKTTVRGGFQRTYGKAGPTYSGGLRAGPGADGTTSGVNVSDPTLQAIFTQRALNLTDLPLVVPATPSRSPQDKVYPVGARSPVVSPYVLFDPGFRTPYTDNWNLTVTRSLTPSLTLEVRTVNALARDQAGTLDLNTVNVHHNPELFNALEVTRAGGDDPLFDQMLMGLNLNVGVPGYGPVGTCVPQPIGSTDPRRGLNCTGANDVLQRGSGAIRRAFGPALANGNYVGVVSGTFGGLLNANPVGLEPLPLDPSTGTTLVTSQRVLRNGCDRIAGGVNLSGFTANGVQILPRCFPEDYLITNPQWNIAQYSRNMGYTNYNSLHVQLTMRPTHGLSFQSTYSVSKTMVQPGANLTDPLNPAMDYGESTQSVGSDFRTNGTFELPIGPNKLFLGRSSGWVGRLLERWQMAFIYNISSGSPRTVVTGNNMLYANGRPNIVGPWTNPGASVTWNGQNGSFFTHSYATYSDPQCQSVTTLDNLRAACSLRGLAVVVPESTPGSIKLSNNSFGIPVLENPTPGHQGNLGFSTLNTLSRWRLDGNLSKTFAISESKSLQFRIDATNILNHPTPADPSISFTDNFGQITTKTGSRTFQAMLRISF